ncbi:hypothetical protein RIF29_05683 [Crotalaria pallida]|uniref:Ubiquitin-like domain-containing protein n=1 Tax=Crotalaria pallida TaxID=3830 RepID=A0AAN9J3S9_CROPI
MTSKCLLFAAFNSKTSQHTPLFPPSQTPTTATMVFIVPPNQPTVSLNPNPKTTTLRLLNLHIQLTLNIPISHQRLFLSLQSLSSDHNDSLPISDLGVGPYSTLTLHIPLLGGTQPPALSKPRFDFLNSKPPPNYEEEEEEDEGEEESLLIV